MQEPGFQKNRRLRVFAGPNGSGKSTIFSQIDKNFDIGHYVNADELELQLRSHSFVDLKVFGISDLSEGEFRDFLGQHSIVAKARSEGY